MSESCFELMYFCSINELKTVASIAMHLKQNFLFDFENWIKYWVSAVNIVLSDPCVGPKPKIKVSFFLLSICTDELISVPKIMTFLPVLPSGNEHSECESNQIP